MNLWTFCCIICSNLKFESFAVIDSLAENIRRLFYLVLLLIVLTILLYSVFLSEVLESLLYFAFFLKLQFCYTLRFLLKIWQFCYILRFLLKIWQFCYTLRFLLKIWQFCYTLRFLLKIWQFCYIYPLFENYFTFFVPHMFDKRGGSFGAFFIFAERMFWVTFSSY